MSDTQLDAPRPSLSDVLGRYDQSDEGEVLAQSPAVTIRPKAQPHGTSLERLAYLRADPATHIETLGELGRGGMGIVHLAEQRALGRRVAVKRVLDEVKGRRVSEQLLLEAWVLGQLEHPNVVPVHDLLVDEEGEPIVVLKRIEGESWHSLMADDARVREQFGVDDVLEWHLGVLVAVCNAVAFAHSRGFLHRDLKPENVMVGRFGEVYVVDWGVAVALRDDGTGRFPLASEVDTFSGTPAYMAPEMLGGRGAKLGVHTDVYLLGATLYHLLAGHPPHRGEDLIAIAAELVDDPEWPEDAPPALLEICRTAMAMEVRERYPSVDFLRAAITDYLRNRDAVLLAEEGEAKLRELRALAEEASSADDPEAHRVAMFNLFSEARLGFRLARRMWPKSEQARQGLVDATAVMVAYLLGRGDVPSAVTLAGQQRGGLPHELEVRLARAKEEDQTQRRRMARLEARDREHDPTIGRRARFVAYALLAVQFVVVEAIAQVWHPLETHVGFVAGSTFVCAAIALAGVVFRRALLSTELNRQLFLMVLLAFVGKLIVHVAVAMLGHAAWEGHALSGVVYAVAATAAAIFHQPRFTPIAIAFGAAVILSIVFPPWRYAIYAGAGAVMLITLVFVHRAERSRDAHGGTGASA